MSYITTEKKQRGIQYSDRAIKRAEIALCCSPFKLKLLETMGQTSVSLSDIAETTGIEKGYTKKTISENNAENNLMWLIQVGLLRREVDGQGITDSFRLTPLGKKIIEIWDSREGSLPDPSWWERLLNAIERWLRLPI
ncbi:MAG: Npun_F0494 family protein [Prochloraceae cyanobacterium]